MRARMMNKPKSLIQPVGQRNDFLSHCKFMENIRNPLSNCACVCVSKMRVKVDVTCFTVACSSVFYEYKQQQQHMCGRAYTYVLVE